MWKKAQIDVRYCEIIYQITNQPRTCWVPWHPPCWYPWSCQPFARLLLLCPAPMQHTALSGDGQFRRRLRWSYTARRFYHLVVVFSQKIEAQHHPTPCKYWSRENRWNHEANHGAIWIYMCIYVYNYVYIYIYLCVCASVWTYYTFHYIPMMSLLEVAKSI